MAKKRVREVFETVITTSANGLRYPVGIGSILANSTQFTDGDRVRVTVERIQPKRRVK